MQMELMIIKLLGWTLDIVPGVCVFFFSILKMCVILIVNHYEHILDYDAHLHVASI